MFNKIKEAGKVMEAQKKYSELKKQLESIEAEAYEGNIKVKLKGDIAMYKIDSIEIDGVEVKELSKAVKKASKDLNKKLRKRFKSGELDMGDMGI